MSMGRSTAKTIALSKVQLTTVEPLVIVIFMNEAPGGVSLKNHIKDGVGLAGLTPFFFM